MEILTHSEGFRFIDDQLRFHCMKGIVRFDNVLYAVEWDDRFRLPVDRSQLRIIKKIETQDRGPLIKDGWTIAAPDPIFFIKMPSIYAYYDISDLESLISREVETCELLKRNPHPHVSPYFGCTAVRGRVSGLCFKKHQQTLSDMVNPRGLSKAAFLESDERRQFITDSFKQAFDGLRGAIHHLHCLGIIHNDITPANIMVDEDGTFVLIDFDSCRRKGELLDNTKRTYGWHDRKAQVSLEENDWNAYTELNTWLFGSSADAYLFA